MAKDELEILSDMPVPKPSQEGRRLALAAAMQAFDESGAAAEKNVAAPQGTIHSGRLSTRATTLWSRIMDRRTISTPAIATILALPAAAFATYYLSQGSPFQVIPQKTALDTGAGRAVEPAREEAATQERSVEATRELALDAAPPPLAPNSMPVPMGAAPPEMSRAQRGPVAAGKFYASPQVAIAPEPMPPVVEDRDRIEFFDTNPVRSVLDSPVSTFSIDVDTASYALVRSSLENGVLPQADGVRVEEMINYFPYDWEGPADASVPFKSTVAVMPSPWNPHTWLMHVAIKGYDVKPAQKPVANLVFLIDTSGSMNAPDKLPLLKSAFRLLVDRLGTNDTVSIVTYAGSAGTVLEPTKGSERAKILAALDRLDAGGSTAGEAGIREAYRLAQENFVEGGVNRVMLATDGDFNVGQTSDEDLKRLVEEKRRSGVYLSLFGFGRGNYNDQMMQAIAQNGNGTASYIDTLAEAEKTLVQEASSTLFTIAADVKIQVEFNPVQIAEYRLIGYETRALKREDFNNDRVDAGDIGSGHSVTAIYEITPKDPARAIDDLRYGKTGAGDTAPSGGEGEYAFVKIRYKLPGEEVSRLIEQPVTRANEIASFDAAGADQRFSVAVAAFGQKLRDTDQTAGLGYDRILEIAAAARGADPFGYRAEFLRLVRLASALDASRR